MSEESAVAQYIALCKALGGGWPGATIATAAASAAGTTPGPASPAPAPTATP